MLKHVSKSYPASEALPQSFKTTIGQLASQQIYTIDLTKQIPSQSSAAQV
jgi:hypothetical protein